MPYGGLPKSGCTMRVAVGLAGERPLMKSINAADPASTGALLMSRFHQFVGVKTWRPGSGPSRTGGTHASTVAAEAKHTTTARAREGTPIALHVACHPEVVEGGGRMPEP